MLFTYKYKYIYIYIYFFFLISVTDKTSNKDINLGRVSFSVTATRYGLDDPCIETQWGRDIPHRPDWSWGLPRLLYTGKRVPFPVVKGPEHGVGHPI